MRPSQYVYEKAKTLWQDCCHHPFVEEMAHGTLEKDKFRFYMIQYALYLNSYAKVFAWGMIKSQTEADIRAFATLLQSALEEESENHHAYLAQLQLTPEILASASPSLTTESYTSYMLKVASEDGPAEIAAAVLACSWSYAIIGSYAASFPGGLADPIFAHWIQTYISEAYQATNDATIALFDRLASHYCQTQLEHLSQIVENCSRYEWLFWEMAWKKEM